MTKFVTVAGDAAASLVRGTGRGIAHLLELLAALTHLLKLLIGLISPRVHRRQWPSELLFGILQAGLCV